MSEAKKLLILAVTEMKAKGYSNAAIATYLDIHESTVRTILAPKDAEGES